MADKKLHTPALLCIMDGFGLAPTGPENAVSQAKLPYIDSLLATYPHTTLGASGEDVGLPDGQMGNSEVGHLNIGAGRIVFQELSRINNAVRDGSLDENPVLLDAMEAVKNGGATLHIMGLVSNGGVHSSLDHAKALVTMAARHGVKRIRIDAFTDGRDVDPQSGAGFMEDLQVFLEQVEKDTGADAKIATVSGRYWGMDRDNRWERVERAYNAIVSGEGRVVESAAQGLRDFYVEDPRGDEFAEPMVIDGAGAGTKDGDAFIFFNFRPDRAREMTRALTDADFQGFKRAVWPSLAMFVTMTEYDPTLDVSVAFPKTTPDNVLADVVADNGLKQFHTAETEKYAHVTFFLNGGIEAEKEGETRVLIPSPKVATYDLQPEMSAPQVTERLAEAIRNDEADVYIVNYANGDMVGHTGVLKAAIKAVETVDVGLSRVVPEILKKGGFALITADHGNADHMYDVEPDGERKPFTAHTTNRVPFIVVDEDAKLNPDITDARLSDIAPTMLSMIGLPIPEQMTGRVLVEE
jgi:2,3-bisphosphoglycerate-independent phosphoglycerate mutase